VSIVGDLINLFEDWKNIDSSREDIQAHADYLYHATNTYNVHDIADTKKLHTHRPGYGTDQEEWPDGSREKRSYWTHEPNIARSFYPEGKPALLRAKRSAADFKRESTGDHYLRKPLASHHLEVYDGEGNWRAVHRGL
jgi:hypothetical protein